MSNSNGRVFLTGDTHGSFSRVISFCKEHHLTADDALIILGDVGLNYYGDPRDNHGKTKLAALPCTFFCIHGNHEARPTPKTGYRQTTYRGGKVWVQDIHPNILFAIDGEVFNFAGKECIVIGGAYSVDKYYRLARGWHWFEDEQPSPEIRRKVEGVLDKRGWKVDVVLSHTCPAQYEPIEVFLPMIDQRKVDKSTEEWLGKIEERLTYDKWFCGHYHTSKSIDKLRFMFEDFLELE